MNSGWRPASNCCARRRPSPACVTSSAPRRELPWERVSDAYRFEGPTGTETLDQLFAGRSTLVVYHFMFGPGWEEGCDGCSFLADHFDGANLHLAHHDVSLVAVSRAPWQAFQDFKRRMGWQFKRVSSHGCDFNADFGVSATPEAIAAGTARYNYDTSRDPGRRCPASACSSACRRARCSTPIPPTRAGWTCWWAPTTSSTCCPRAVTRTKSWIGCATTTATKVRGRAMTAARPGPGRLMALTQARQRVEAVYREESRRVLATLIRLLGDFELAEEALHDAFIAAVEQWPVDGVPANPRAWLVSAGRFKAIDALRRRACFDARQAQLIIELERDEPEEIEDVEDDRLRLIFTCCHPALPADAQVPLTLREVCDLKTEEIARAFLATPSTIAQRIVRAKAKIRDARIPYQVPSMGELPERLDNVLRVIYLVFNEGYSATSGDS